jgi:hypothetical protein
MPGTFPNQDCSDLETRVRVYLNEVTASFFTQAEIWSWLSMAMKDIAQVTTCVRRIQSVVTVINTRTVAAAYYKVFHVEYVPSSGRALFLRKITPIQIGHCRAEENGLYPQYWYEFGSTIGIEPLPDGVYNLNLYIADVPKMVSGGVYTEADYTAVGNQTELAPMWQHLMVIYAVMCGLIKDEKLGPARMFESIYRGELAYLKRNVIDIIPDGLDDQVLQRG